MLKCLICGESRIVERAHLVPKILFKDVSLPKVYKPLEDVIILCSTHHRLFDLGRLNKSEMEVIKPLIDDRLRLLSLVLEALQLASDEVDKRMKLQYVRHIQRFHKYISRIAVMYYGRN